MCSMSTSSSSTKKRLSVYLKSSILKHAKANAVIEELTLTDLVEKALVAYLPKLLIIKKPLLLNGN